MRPPFPKLALLSAVCAFCAGCTAGTQTRYPDITPFPNTYASANREPRGSDAFCRTYGRQSAANRLKSLETDGRGPSGIAVQQARREGDRAYARCRSGRLN